MKDDARAAAYPQAQTRQTIRTTDQGFVEFTETVRAWMAEQALRDGLLTLFVRHTSCSLLIQENIDPDVQADLTGFFQHLVPQQPRERFAHAKEGPDDMPAHIKAALTQTSLSIPVEGRAPLLGRYQGIFLFEHRDGGRPREVVFHWLGG